MPNRELKRRAKAYADSPLPFRYCPKSPADWQLVFDMQAVAENAFTAEHLRRLNAQILEVFLRGSVTCAVQ